MCERYDPCPGMNAIAPNLLRLILKTIGPPYLERDLVLVDHTKEMVRIAHDTACYLDGVWESGSDCSFVRLDNEGAFFRVCLTETLERLRGGSVEPVQFRDELHYQLMLLDKLRHQLELEPEEYRRLDEFLDSLVAILRIRAAALQGCL